MLEGTAEPGPALSDARGRYSGSLPSCDDCEGRAESPAMVGAVIAGSGVSGMGLLGPSVTIICGTPDDAASGCVACEALLPSV